MKKLIALLLALVMVIGLAACGGSATTETKAPAATEAPTQAEAPAETEAAGNTTDLPRDETLYFAGQQWGTVNSWNVIGTNQNNAMALAAGAGYRTTMFETLYMPPTGLTARLSPPPTLSAPGKSALRSATAPVLPTALSSTASRLPVTRAWSSTASLMPAARLSTP